MCKQARWTIQRDRCKFEAVVSNRIVTRTSTASTTLDKYLRRGPSGISGVSAVAVESFDTLIGAFTLVLPVYRSADCMQRFDFHCCIYISVNIARKHYHFTRFISSSSLPNNYEAIWLYNLSTVVRQEACVSSRGIKLYSVSCISSTRTKY